jgi:hypothetical protein
MVYLLIGMAGLPLMGSAPNGEREDRGPGPLDETEVWTDSFDDMSHVYVPDGGLVGVEVTSGEVRLKAGENKGWIASSIIKAKPGYRYDFVLLNASTPGNSSVNISILDASEEASEIGFANETIPEFKLKEGPCLDVNSTNQTKYPEIRIQVNLIADGANQPILYSWSLYYVPLDEWRDDLIGPWKMTNNFGLNFTGDRLELNLSENGASGPIKYKKFPTVITAGPNSQVDFLYANPGRTDYRDASSLSLPGLGITRGVDIDDVNKDGYLDLLVGGANGAKILWGDGSGKWTVGNSRDFATYPVWKVATGDFNGDKQVDFAFACINFTGTGDSTIFLNKGNGAFTATPDITFTDMDDLCVKSGDINKDGFDDVVFASYKQPRSVNVYYGGPTGPDTTADITITSGFNDLLLEDLNKDTYLDLMVSKHIYMGDENGIWL